MPAVARSLRAPIGELARNPAERRTDTAGMRTLTFTPDKIQPSAKTELSLPNP